MTASTDNAACFCGAGGTWTALENGHVRIKCQRCEREWTIEVRTLEPWQLESLHAQLSKERAGVDS